MPRVKSNKTKTAAKKNNKTNSKLKSSAKTKSVSKSAAKSVSAKKSKNDAAKIKSAQSSSKAINKTYLSDKELKHFKDLIIDQKNEILENARRLRESLVDENTGDYIGDHSTFSMHMAEQGTDEMEREKTFMLIQRDEKHLFYLEKALERIAKKTYGLCISCGKPISKARLEAVPITSHCINCKETLSG